MAEQPELNKWKRYNVARLLFKKDLAIGGVCLSLEQCFADLVVENRISSQVCKREN